MYVFFPQKKKKATRKTEGEEKTNIPSADESSRFKSHSQGLFLAHETRVAFSAGVATSCRPDVGLSFGQACETL